MDWAIYDRAELLDTVSPADERGRRHLLLSLPGLHCASCVARVEKVFDQLGVHGEVNLAARTAEVDWTSREAPLSRILGALEQSGYEPRVLAQVSELRRPANEQRAALRRIAIAVLGSMQVMMLAWPAYSHAGSIDASLALLLRYAQWLFATPVVIYSGWPFFASAAQALRSRMVNMDVPVALALVVAYATSAWRTMSGDGELYFDTATMFVLLLGIGRYFEGRTRAAASERLRVLAGQVTLTAMRRRDAVVEQVPVSALRVGDEVIVAPGAAIPIDGVVMDEPGELDESLLTGESKPVTRRAGDRMLAGSLNVGSGNLLMRCTAIGASTRLSQITQLLHHAQSERPAFALLSDRVAAWFIGIVLALALVGAWHWRAEPDVAISVALAVLVASCPCALALAVPAVFAASTSKLAADGVLVVHARILSRLAAVDTIVFDKTGTLTGTELRVSHIVTAPGVDDRRCLEIAAALQAGGIHPIARAFARTPTQLVARDVRQSPGAGLEGDVGGTRWSLRAANAVEDSWIAQAIESNPELTWIALGNPTTAALFGLAAAERGEAPEVVRALRASGREIHLLSGDAMGPVTHLADQLGIDRRAARQTPEQKLARLQALRKQGRVVMAVGDGVNDAPLLGAADVAVVMPAGAALAQSSADAILIGDSLRGLPAMFDAGAHSQKLIAQNLAWALVYNLSVLPLAAANLLHPWLAALGMSLSSLLVVANALRLAPAPWRRR
ncbi:MAG TPA: cation-translocating P-type ATPase [Nevskiaceae bacterium]|nr:cation-translocating P-type ATPase [Nevskiaceae bacterium]